MPPDLPPKMIFHVKAGPVPGLVGRFLCESGGIGADLLAQMRGSVGAAGWSSREIARALSVSEATVKTHINRIFAKTGSRDRAQAIRCACTHGYAEPSHG
jgi:hypothetical protein